MQNEHSSRKNSDDKNDCNSSQGENAFKGSIYSNVKSNINTVNFGKESAYDKNLNSNPNSGDEYSENDLTEGPFSKKKKSKNDLGNTFFIKI